MNSRAEMLRRQEEIISRMGWMVQGVFPTRENPGPDFSYSIGLHEQGVHELIIMGLPMQVAGPLINAVATSLLEAKVKGESYNTTFTHPAWPMPFALVEVPAQKASDYATGAHNRSKGQAQYIQIIWPDKQNRFPWHPDAEQSYRDAQLMLGHLN